MEGFFSRSGVSNYFFIIVIISTPLRSTLSNKKEKKKDHLSVEFVRYCGALLAVPLQLLDLGLDPVNLY